MHRSVNAGAGQAAMVNGSESTWSEGSRRRRSVPHGERPGERLTERGVTLTECGDALHECCQAGQVVGCQHFALQD